MNLLVTVPSLSQVGGVSNFWNSLFEAFREIDDLSFTPLEIGGHGKNPIGPLMDQWYFRKALNSDSDLFFLNPSLIIKSFFRDGLFAKQLIQKRRPFVVFFHGWEFEFQEKVDTKYRNFFLNSFAHAKKIFVLSHEFKEKLLEWGYHGEVVVLTTAVDVSLIENFSLAQKMKSQQKRSTTTILFLSRIIKEKGIFELIEAFESLLKKGKDMRLIIAGDGEDLDALKQAVLAKEQVRFTGYVEGEEKIALLKESDIFCLPSYTEGLPISVLEAMLFGLPVVTTRVGGLKRFFKEGQMGYLIEPQDSEEIEKKIALLLSNKERQIKMSRFNYLYAKEHLTNQVVATNLYHHMKEVL